MSEYHSSSQEFIVLVFLPDDTFAPYDPEWTPPRLRHPDSTPGSRLNHCSKVPDAPEERTAGDTLGGHIGYFVHSEPRGAGPRFRTETMGEGHSELERYGVK